MNESQPPRFDEVVDKFNLKILKQPADLAIKDGDLALTKSGDLMLNDAPYSALFRLVQRWRFNAPTLLMLFNSIMTSRRRQQELNENLSQVFSGTSFLGSANSPTTRAEQSKRFNEIHDELGASALGAEACAAAAVLVLNSLLLGVKEDLDISQRTWERTGPLIGGVSVGAIFSASANNFRHRDEWRASRLPNTRQLSSIKVLASALGETIAPDGAGHKLSRDVSLEILERLSNGNWETLNCLFFEFSHNLALNTQS